MKKQLPNQRFDPNEPYLMRIADLLSDDPMIVRVIGPRFRVVAWVDEQAKRVNYSFRGVDDTAPD